MRRNAVWLLGSRVAADLLNFLLFIVISRRFGPAGVGVYAYGFAIAGFVYAMTTLGIDEYGIREYTRQSRSGQLQLMQRLTGAQASITAVVVVLLAVYLALTNRSWPMLLSVLWLTIYQLGSAIAGTLFVPVMANQRMLAPAVASLVCRSMAFAIAAIALWLGARLETALAGFACAGVGVFVVAAMSAAKYGHALRLVPSVGVLRDAAGTLWSFAAIDLLSQLLSRIAVIVLTLQAGAAAAGIYATGWKFVEAACMPVFFLGMAAYPKLSQTFHGHRAAFRSHAWQLAWPALAITLCASLAMWWLVPLLVVPVLGPRYAGSEAVLASMAALALMLGLEFLLGRLLLAADGQVPRAKWIAVAAALCATATLVLVPRFGIDGAINAATGAYLLVNVLYAASLYSSVSGNVVTPVGPS
jgi:O-antigen/teichoic acid export membrane protein